MPNPSKLKKQSNVANILWFEVEGYFKTPTEIVISEAQPMKAHIIDKSLNESIVMSYYLLSPVNHHQLTDLLAFHKYNDRL